MGRGPHTTFRFGVFEVDTQSGELRKQGVRVRLQDQPFQILVALLERPGEIILREELRARIWPADTFVNFDHGLYSAIKRLRDVLGDSADVPRYVETVSRQGYRLVASVERGTPTGTGPQEPIFPTVGSFTSGPSHGPAVRARRRRWLSVALVFVIGISAAAVVEADLFFRKPALSIAVLPFEYPAGDHFLENAANTLANGLIVDLTGLSRFGLATKARSTVQPFQSRLTDPMRAGKDLHADLVFSGRLARIQGQLAVDAELLSVSEGNSLWAARDLRWERFQLQVAKRDLLNEILTRLPLKLSVAKRAEALKTEPGRRRSGEAEAIETSAQALFWTGTPEGFRKSIELRRKEMEQLEPSAAPLGGIASAYVAMSDLEMISPQEGHAKALEWANRALRLDGMDFGALIALDRLERNLEWDSEAFKDNELVRGRLDEILAEQKRFLSDEPKLPAAYDLYANSLILARKFEEAIEQERIALELDPKHAWAHLNLGYAYLYQRRFQDAIDEFELSRDGLPIHGLTGVASALAYSGQKQEARAKLKVLQELSQKQYVSPLMLARIYVALGDRNRAFKYMTDACENRVPALLSLKYNPAWDGLRRDNRFAEIIHCAGLQH